MNICTINIDTPEKEVIKEAASVLRRGGVLVYPTDTCYGLGCDARNVRAMNKIAEMKGRDIEKKFSVIAPSIKAIETIAAVTQNQRDILHHYLPGPFTFVLPNADFSVARTSTLGIRVPDCAVTAAIGTAFGEPYITTSANISGTGALYSFEEINAHLLQRLPDALLPDLVLNAGDLPRTDASTVVDLTSPTPSIIRQGSGSFSSHR